MMKPTAYLVNTSRGGLDRPGRLVAGHFDAAALPGRDSTCLIRSPPISRSRCSGTSG